MRTQSWESGRKMAAEAMAADGARRRFVEQSRMDEANLEEDSLPSPAMGGLLVAIALSIPFWMALVALGRRMLR